MTSLIALVIVVFWVIALWFQLSRGTEEAIRSAQAVSAILGPILGAVLGYYFGAASGERLAKEAQSQAREALTTSATVKAIGEEEIEEADADIQVTTDHMREALAAMSEMRAERDALLEEVRQLKEKVSAAQGADDGQ